MCNLSEGTRISENKGIAIGETQERTRLILQMHHNGLTAKQIAEITEKSMEEILTVITNS